MQTSKKQYFCKKGCGKESIEKKSSKSYHCECGSWLYWNCSTCGKEISASNKSKHKCIKSQKLIHLEKEKEEIKESVEEIKESVEEPVQLKLLKPSFAVN